MTAWLSLPDGQKYHIAPILPISTDRLIEEKEMIPIHQIPRALHELQRAATNALSKNKPELALSALEQQKKLIEKIEEVFTKQKQQQPKITAKGPFKWTNSRY